ncbi:MAG TPA: TIGR02996 domain-containing protein [Gemmataceae bacterium]|nr:TIGR02996 domain-containing protein [Gemmataceae bacterium]
MSDHAALLAALEAAPDDDGAWLVYADYAEEHNFPFAAALREAVARRAWCRCRDTLARSLSRRQRRLLACDCVERLLPLFESRYPDDRRPRELVEVLRQYATGKRVAAARAAVARACRVATADTIRNADRFQIANAVAYIAYGAPERPTSTCRGAALAAVAGAFGRQVFHTPAAEFASEWSEALQAECRWQLARLLARRAGV